MAKWIWQLGQEARKERTGFRLWVVPTLHQQPPFLKNTDKREERVALSLSKLCLGSICCFDEM